MSWVLASSLVLGAALIAGFAWYERTHPTSRVIALVAALAALAALGRIAFAPLPNVKPTTDIVLIAGYVLGGAPGFVIGAVTALASNLFFGQGPWTPWQMVAWGGVGVGGAVLGRLTAQRLGRVGLAVACGVAGLAFGAVMNLHLWVLGSGDHTVAQLAAFFATSLPFDLAHAIGNVVFCLAFGPALVRALQRFRTRMEVSWVPAPATAVLLVALVVVTAPAPARAQTADAAAASASLRYLTEAQNDDGGWGGAPGQSSSGLYTGWAALGVAAAGRNPLDAGSPNAIAYTKAHAGELNDLGEITRTILILRAAGLSPRIGDRDLVAELLAQRRPNGSFAGRVNTTAFAALALRAAGRSPSSRPLRTAGRWMAGQAGRDGGFNFAGRGGPSGIDDTGAAIQGLVAAGRKGTKTVRRAVRFVLRRQNRDGGFPLTPGGGSNAQSTAWAVQGFLAAGRNPAKVRTGGSRDPMAYLRSLTDSSGEVRYSRTSRQTPVWVTAQAVMALARKPLPLTPVPRTRSGRPDPPERKAPAAEPAATPAKTPRPAGTPKPKPEPRAVASASPSPLAAAVMSAAAAPREARRIGFAAGAVAAAVM